MNSRPAIRDTSLYGGLLVLLLAAGWLLPNHYPPWNTFHSNAWIAGALVVLAFWRLANRPDPLQVSVPVLFLVACAAIPWIQHGAGLVALPSAALLSSLYMVGVAVAFLLGQNDHRGKAGDMAGMILTAACLASVISVGLQTCQWLGLGENVDLENPWLFPSGRSRPVANLGQPNQLGSLLLWGVLGAGWALYKGWIRRVSAIVLMGIILFGAALTESRTVLLTLTLTVVALALWRIQFIGRTVVRWALLLYAWYMACLFGLAPLGRLMGFTASSTVFERSAGEVRFALWRMALDASSHRPWLGYGWDEFNEAFLLVFPQYPVFNNLYAEHSHNLPLDLVIWVGWPLGIILVLCLARWLLQVVRSISDMGQLLKVSAMGVMLVHAMLELPLHYGYFLWPFGVLAGSASAGLGLRTLGEIPRTAVAAILAGFSISIAVIVHDYLNIEAAFVELRLQLLHIGRNHDERPPRTFVLNDWGDFIVMSRTVPKAGMPDSEISKWRSLLLYNTSPLAFRKVGGALVLNGHLEEAKYWADRYCAVLHAKLCKDMLNEWIPPTQPAAP